MSDKPKTASGVVVKKDDKVYFIPQKILDGFAVKNSASIEIMNKATRAETHESYSVQIDPTLARQIVIF
jgi:hypothetical protein